MKKVLLISNGDNFSKGAFQFVRMLRDNEALAVKVIFFNTVDSEQFISAGYHSNAESYLQPKEAEKRIVRNSREEFIHECETSRIKYDIHETVEKWNKELFVKESRFADIAVISAELFGSNSNNQQPNSFMQEALHNTECPMLVIPETFKNIDRIAVAYDGKKESLFALKQFIYLLPQYIDLPAEFVYVKNEETDDIPDLDLLKEYSYLHFNSLATSKLHFEPKKNFANWLGEKKNVLLVSGSYSRSSLSNILNQSFVDRIIQNHTTPVFIAHSV